MAPTEASILGNFLLPAASLSSAITQQKFTKLFPRDLQANPQVGSLYGELRHQRAVDVDDVKLNIEAEVTRGKDQKYDVVASRINTFPKQLGDLSNREIHIEHDLGRIQGTDVLSEPHTLDSVLANLEAATLDMQAEIATLENDIANCINDINGTIGGLSDLRYGKFHRISGVTEDAARDAVRGLGRLDEHHQQSRRATD